MRDWKTSFRAAAVGAISGTGIGLVARQLSSRVEHENQGERDFAHASPKNVLTLL